MTRCDGRCSLSTWNTFGINVRHAVAGDFDVITEVNSIHLRTPILATAGRLHPAFILHIPRKSISGPAELSEPATTREGDFANTHRRDDADVLR